LTDSKDNSQRQRKQIVRFLEEHMLRIHTRIAAVAVLAVGSLFLAGCPQRTTIEKINRDPGRYAGKEVAIAGRVTNSFGALGTGVFEIEDGTGRMWVFSERYGVPGRGAKLAVVGHVEQGFSFGGRSFATILRETERRH
jgi:hypothetical protein